MEDNFPIVDQLRHFPIDAIILIFFTINDIDAYCHDFRTILAISCVFIDIVCILRRIILNGSYRQIIRCFSIHAIDLNLNRLVRKLFHQQLNIRKLRRRLRAGHQNDILHRALHLIRSVVALILIALFQLHLIHPQISCGRQDLIQKISLGLYTVYIGGNGIFLVYIEDLAVFHQVIHTVYRYHDVPVDFFVG